MVQAAAPAKLSQIKLTEAEIDSASNILQAADAKQMNSLKAGLNAFIAVNPDDKIFQDNRFNEQFLLRLIGHQARCAAVRNTLVSDKSFTQTKGKFTDVERMSTERMDTVLGKAKGALWRTVLKGMPDSLKGRTEPEYLEYPVPKNWERMAQA